MWFRRRRKPDFDHPVQDLASLPTGSLAVVGELRAATQFRRRLLDLGFVPGTIVRAVRRSPVGDPIAVDIRGTTIALRLDDARQITVRPVHG
ncbi:MAG: FeoA family protein [Eubacteriales bacterium]|jgi:ferrous iron transport protein A|nr:ferrous iron transport protein A [Pseudomonadota bacterium]MBU4532581.1 ferrous iron transport protein A [Bacillota bacterium]MBV1728526.1 ferrous iron transport protein A [Desulforudis sp.]MDQ7789124.1 FeoA family protein [Clostridia bacterium]MDZ4042597.1 FeoA family protein [Eubacteriales bacterium]